MNDNAYCLLCIECSLASIAFWASISLFCPLLFMLSSYPLASLSLLKTPGSLTFSISWLEHFLSLSSLKQQLLGSPQVVSEPLHHHPHHCLSRYHQHTSLVIGSNRSSNTAASFFKPAHNALQIQCHATDKLNTSLHSYGQIK